MKIAISAALVLGFAHYGGAFPCTWNGAGSSYVYTYTQHYYNNDNRCITSVENFEAQTTCCR